MLDIKYRFTCGDSDLREIIKKCQNFMRKIVFYSIKLNYVSYTYILIFIYYALHIINLKQALNHGLVFRKSIESLNLIKMLG